MERKDLPIGIQDFPTLVRRGCTYVDKTEFIHRLICQGVCYYLSRPRRFSKSLLLSTVAALFHGDRALFAGLWISRTDYRWPVHPVILLDFSRLASGSATELTDSLRQ